MGLAHKNHDCCKWTSTVYVDYLNDRLVSLKCHDASSRILDAFSFLSPALLVFATYSQTRDGGASAIGAPSLELYALPEQSLYKVRFVDNQDLRLLRSLNLPESDSIAHIINISIRSDPAPIPHGKNMPFHLSPDHRLFVVQLMVEAQIGGVQTFTFFIPLATFMKALPTRYGGA